MNKHISLGLQAALLAAVASALALPRAAAQFPSPYFNVQARLLRPDGTPVPDSQKSVRFSIWDAAQGGNQLWSSQDTVTVKDGLFADTLNVGNTFIGAVAQNALYLEIKVESDAPMTPRQALTSVPYAMFAAGVPNGSITSDQIANGSVTGSKLAGPIAAFGPAGGDLTGTYPNPSLQTQASLLYKVSGGVMSTGATTTPALDQQQTQHTLNLYNPNWQSFTPSKDGFLTGLDLWIGALNTSHYATGTVSLYTGEGTSGTLLASSAISFAGDPAWNHVAFTSSVPLTAGAKYSVAFSNVSNLQLGYINGNGSAYPGGQTDALGQDYAFKTYMSNAGIGVGAAPSAIARVAVADPGDGTSGLLVGSPSNIASGSNAKILIAQTSGTAQWPFEIDKAGAILYGIRTDGSVVSASSRRYKQNIAPLKDALETALKLRPVTFDWKPAFGGGHDIGLVAEDTAKTMPELAVQSADGKETLGVRYDRLGVVALEAIKQQQAVIAAQQKEIAALTARLAALERAPSGKNGHAR